jgi:hypothetical protein
MSLDILIKNYKKKLDSVNSEVRELDLRNIEDIKLQKKLEIKIDCYKIFITDLENLLKEKTS